jgi:hypothetical protein
MPRPPRRTHRARQIRAIPALRDLLRLSLRKRSHRRSKPRLERRQIVAPLQHERDAPLRALVRHSRQCRGHPAERSRRKLHRRQGIALGRVEPRAHQDELGHVLRKHGQDHTLEHAPVYGIASARGEGHVDREAGAFALPGFPRSTCAGVKRPLMRRHVEDGWVAIEHLLGAVAVVDVPVDDGDAGEAAGARMGGGDRHVVEQAEAHGLRSPRVVPRWAYESDAA